mmetsp:Transcript_3507/g.5329  ORF Transcript_3507/g.5329 Transcript_3507/m.5329 type:complete len:687 (-) Transcript_3507:294-2354(-)
MMMMMMMVVFFLSRGILGEDGRVREGGELVTISHVELVLELNPVETKGVEEGREGFHEKEDTDSEASPDGPSDEDGKEATLLEHEDHDTLPEDLRQLGVGQTEGPETKVGGSVGDASEDVLDGVDDLVDEDLAKVKLFTVLTMTAAGDAGDALLAVLLEEAGAVALGAHLLVVEVAEDEGLGEEHERDGDEGEGEEDDLDDVLAAVHLVLWGVLPGVEDHGDHEVEELGRVLAGPVGEPLVDDEQVHVAKDAEHEDDLGDPLKDKVEGLHKVDLVEEREDETKEHLDDTHDDRHLHLERVVEEQLVGRDLPVVVDTKGVSVVGVGTGGVGGRADGLVGERAERPVGGEDGGGETEALVVEGSAVDGEEGHEDDEVATAEEHDEHLVDLLVLDLGVDPEHGERGEEEEEAVANVTKHDTKEEGEGDDGKGRGVDLLVAGHTVRVDELLELLGELVGLVVSGWGLVRGDDLERSTGDTDAATLSKIEGRVDEGHVLVVVGAPALSDQTATTDIVVEEVHGVVDALLADDLGLPDGELGGDGVEQTQAVGTGLVEDATEVIETRLDLHPCVGTLLSGLRAGIEVGLEGVTELSDLDLSLSSLVQHDKHVLLKLLTSAWVLDVVLNLSSAEEEVTTGGTPEDTLEGGHLGARDDTSQETEGHVDAGLSEEGRVLRLVAKGRSVRSTLAKE